MILRSNAANSGSYIKSDVSLRSISVSKSKTKLGDDSVASVFPGAQNIKLNARTDRYVIIDVEGLNMGEVGIMMVAFPSRGFCLFVEFELDLSTRNQQMNVGFSSHVVVIGSELSSWALHRSKYGESISCRGEKMENTKQIEWFSPR